MKTKTLFIVAGWASMLLAAMSAILVLVMLFTGASGLDRQLETMEMALWFILAVISFSAAEKCTES